jgi:hypothetical protein
MLQRKPDVPTIDGVISVISDHVVTSRVSDQASDAMAASDNHTLNLEQIASDALDQLRQLTQEHAAIGGQVLALERQVRTLLIERLELSAQVASLQRENAKLRGTATNAPAVTRPTALPRHEPFTPLRGGPSPTHRPSQPLNDQEALLAGNTLADTPAPFDHASPNSSTPVGYILIAQPFGRFSDLGRFQTAVQALRGVQNARVRRFAQGTLEMRLDYDGPIPLPEALAGLALAVEAIEQIEPHRLVIRLRPDSLV